MDYWDIKIKIIIKIELDNAQYQCFQNHVKQN